MTTLLSFDTATESASLALCSPAGEWVREMEGGARASALLVPEVMAMLATAGLTLADVDAIGFGRGPGAFTGLRTACSVAQGLAFGAGKPVLPLDSLMLVAEDARQQLPITDTLELWVAMDARMDEVYAAAYRWQAGCWHVMAEPMLVKPDALNALWATPPACVAGSAVEAMGDRLALPESTQRVPRTQARAQALAAIARQAWGQGAAVDAALALPVYVRDKVAQTTAEREVTRAAKEALAAAAQT